MKTLFEVIAVKNGSEIYRDIFATETDLQAVELGKFYAGDNSHGADWQVLEVSA